MLVTCHDLYHQAWGADEDQARAACLAGPYAPDVLDCRRAACAAAVERESECPAAVGLERCD
jgi:hypothetical protein